MNKELGVKVTYRNAQLEPVYEKSYSINDYTEMLRMDLLRLISDVEDLVYVATDNKPKDEWSDGLWAAFYKIKHKLLDKAGDIGRLPGNLFEMSTMSLSEYVADIVNKGAV
jgi:hypothetical protein